MLNNEKRSKRKFCNNFLRFLRLSCLLNFIFSCNTNIDPPNQQGKCYGNGKKNKNRNKIKRVDKKTQAINKNQKSNETYIISSDELSFSLDEFFSNFTTVNNHNDFLNLLEQLYKDCIAKKSIQSKFFQSDKNIIEQIVQKLINIKKSNRDASITTLIDKLMKDLDYKSRTNIKTYSLVISPLMLDPLGKLLIILKSQNKETKGNKISQQKNDDFVFLGKREIWDIETPEDLLDVFVTEYKKMESSLLLDDTCIIFRVLFKEVDTILKFIEEKIKLMKIVHSDKDTRFYSSINTLHKSLYDISNTIVPPRQKYILIGLRLDKYNLGTILNFLNFQPYSKSDILKLPEESTQNYNINDLVKSIQNTIDDMDTCVKELKEIFKTDIVEYDKPIYIYPHEQFSDRSTLFPTLVNLFLKKKQ